MGPNEIHWVKRSRDLQNGFPHPSTISCWEKTSKTSTTKCQFQGCCDSTLFAWQVNMNFKHLQLFEQLMPQPASQRISDVKNEAWKLGCVFAIHFLDSPCRTDWHTGFTADKHAKGKYSTLAGTLERLKHLCKQTYIFKIPASHIHLVAYLMFGKCVCFLSHLWSMHSGSPVASLLVHQRSLLDVMGCSWGRTNLLQLAGFFCTQGVNCAVFTRNRVQHKHA